VSPEISVNGQRMDARMASWPTPKHKPLAACWWQAAEANNVVQWVSICKSLLTAGEARAMPFTSQWQDLLRKIHSFSTSRTAVWVVMVDIRYRRTSVTTVTGDFCTVRCHLAVTMSAAQCIVSHQVSCRVFQTFATYTCITKHTCSIIIN